MLAFGATREATVTLDLGGSWSRRLEAWEQAPRCRQIASFEGVVHLAAVIVVGDHGDVPPAVRLEEADGRVVVHASVGGYERAITLALSRVPVIDLGG
jgi:hypothetical protein